MKYALIDTANTFFRARHIASRNSDTWEKIGMALHLTLASCNQIVRKFGIDHVVFCLEGRSWRKDYYEPYKKNRVVDTQVQTQAEKEDTSSNIVRSPMVGTAYLSPEPGAKPFVSVGNKVKKGDTILIIEAMKTMNHIQSTVDGEVIEILINDGEAVEFEQALAKIK